MPRPPRPAHPWPACWWKAFVPRDGTPGWRLRGGGRGQSAHRAPGPIADTEGLKRLAPTAEMLHDMAQRVPLKRLGRIEDIARMAMVLASDWGSYITGAVIPVDGGLAPTGPRDFTAAAEATRKARA